MMIESDILDMESQGSVVKKLPAAEPQLVADGRSVVTEPRVRRVRHESVNKAGMDGQNRYSTNKKVQTKQSI